MANTLTDLIPTMYEGLHIVSREQVGIIPAVTRDSKLARVAKGATLTIPIAPPASTYDIVPAATPANDGDQVIGNTQLTISKSKYAPIKWTGEEQLGLAAGPGARMILAQQFAEAIRALTNEIEADLFTTAYQNGSRAYGTPATPMFNTADDFSDLSQLNMILNKNGAPTGDRHVVFGSAALNNLQSKQKLLLQANTSASTDLLRRGSIGSPLLGVNMHYSAAADMVHVKGTAAGATTNNAGYAVGARTITLASAGTGTIKAGDHVQIAGDTNKYVVVSGDTDVSNGGTIVIAQPGLRAAIPAAATNITVVNSFTPSVEFARTALVLATRKPALPEGGDMADDVVELVDPVSGLVFEVSKYKQYKQVKYEVAMAWGTGAVDREHIAVHEG